VTAPEIQPTSYPDINSILHVLLSNVQGVLGDIFVGLYIYGSLASGDFNPQRSDVDFLVVTNGKLPESTLIALKAMHERIAASGVKWATKLEGSYIPGNALRRYDPARSWHPSFWNGKFGVDHHRSDWVIHLHLIRERGIVVAGPHPSTLIDPIQPDDLRRAVLAVMNEWWAPQLDDPSRLRCDEYQVYAILTMCRMIYTLEHGEVASKSVAAHWAQDALVPRRPALIEQAIAWRPGQPFDHLSETIDFIRYIMDRSKKSR